MNKVFLTASCAIATAALSLTAQTQTPVVIARTNFPSRVFSQSEMLKKYDKDGDGKLNDQERAALLADRKAAFEKQRKAMEKEFDKNGDGILDDQERAALRAEMQKRHPLAAQHVHEQMIKRFDKDGDGKLNDEERKAMQQEQVARMQKMAAARAAAAKTASATNAVPAK